LASTLPASVFPARADSFFAFFAAFLALLAMSFPPWSGRAPRQLVSRSVRAERVNDSYPAL
jgi:hypothetical protein